jgi:hypothetical protein
LSKNQEHSQPPQPPTVARRLQFHHLQLIGIPLLLLVPVLALFSVFGETVSSTVAASPELELHVEYPTRFRYKMIDTVMVSFTNVSARTLSSVQVEFERAYVEKFSTVAFTPSVKHVTDAAYIVEVNELLPGETRIISVTIQAEKFGRHAGSITATYDNAERLQVSIDTFAFP